ncbi:MAG: peptidase M56, partial [Oscillospiraceae bacterium]|nr:peptidase M56 [Oscillospiraceae bacterium]
MSVIQMSISAAILITAIVLARSLAVHKLPKRTFVLLWGLVLVRLLIPFSVPVYVPVSLDTAAVESNVAGFFAPTPDARNFDDNASSPAVPTATAENAARIPEATVVWVAGMIVGALFFLITHWRLSGEYKTALPLKSDYVNEWLRKQRLRRAVRVRYSDRINAPMTYGIWKPVILLPKNTDWRDEPRLRYVLAHEITHIRRFD